MIWIKCSKEAYDKCPDSRRCGTLDQAIFLDGSSCHKFNQQIETEGAKEQKPDLVPVVRCKDCIKISPSVTAIKNSVYCREFRSYMPCDGFCSYGERRATDEAD